MRSSTITTAAIPSPAVSALAATGSATVREVAVTTARPIAASAAARITRFGDRAGEPWPSQGPKPAPSRDVAEWGADVRADGVPVHEEHRDQQHDAPAAAIISPRLSLPRSISASSVAHGHRTVLHDRPHWSCIAGRHRRGAALTVLRSSIAIVIGPTPPGTGVIARARSARRLEVDVAHQPLVGAVHADVDHGRPLADHVAASRGAAARRRPRATSARPADLRRGRACASGTPSRSRSRPAAARRPACPPGRCAPPRPRGRPPAACRIARSSSHHARRRRRHEAVRPWTSSRRSSA